MGATISSYKYVKRWIEENLGCDKEDFCGGWCASGLHMDALIEERQTPSQVRVAYIECMISRIVQHDSVSVAKQDKKLWAILQKHDWKNKLIEGKV